MKKVISFILIISSLLLISCGAPKNRSYDEAEVISKSKILIMQSALLNEIFWGEGIPYDPDDNYKNGQYYPADLGFLIGFGADTIDEIMEMTRAVFSKSYSESIYGSVLSAKTGDFGMAGYTRYYQGEDFIMVYSKYKPLLVDEVEYLFDGLSVTGSKGEIVTVKIPIKVTRGEDSQTREIEIDLVEEEGGWRIDSPTYASYR